MTGPVPTTPSLRLLTLLGLTSPPEACFLAGPSSVLSAFLLAELILRAFALATPDDAEHRQVERLYLESFTLGLTTGLADLHLSKMQTASVMVCEGNRTSECQPGE